MKPKPDPDAPEPAEAAVVAAAEAGAARAALAALSPDAWGSVTEANVRSRVQAALAAASDATATVTVRGAVAAEVAAWVAARAASQPATQPPKRERGDDEEEDAGPVKRERGGDEETDEAPAPPLRRVSVSSSSLLELDLPGVGHRRLTVSLLSGAARVDVREWYEKKGADGTTTLAPGLRGASLTPPQFRALVAAAPALTHAVTEGREENVDLGGATAKEAKRGASSLFRGVARVDLRAFYRKADGSWAPTKKGVTLSVEQLQAVVAGAPAALDAVAGASAG
jgi:hypothetical protein